MGKRTLFSNLNKFLVLSVSLNTLKCSDVNIV